jgi:hypothetical protein
MKKLLVLLFFGALVLAGCGSKGDQTNAEKISGSIEDLMSKKKNIRCELSVKSGDDVVSGTTYISGTKARSDYKSKMGEQTVTSHMISDGTWLYTWTEEYPDQAIKMNIKDMEAVSGEAEAQKAGLENYQENFDYNCYGWVKNDAVFTPPSNIKFIDYSEMMKSLQGLLGNPGVGDDGPGVGNADSGSMCAVCDSVPDASAKDSCRKSLGCK